MHIKFWLQNSIWGK